ncbi:MAG: helix-turn-helix protein [Chitinophagaceae bacterium]|nr:helix-turn-helix protein [Chitinophagaceae bacterium]
MKQVTIVVPNGQTVLSSITGPFEILSRANDYWRNRGKTPLIKVRIAGFEKEQQFDAGYCTMHPENIANLEATDLIIIPSVAYHEQLISNNAALIQWITDKYKNGSEIASICSGAFLLASTGLLEGKSCSTHWNNASNFRRLFPGVAMVADKLITSDSGIHTNGGAFSFLNLMLFLVEKYFDRDTAIWCSKTFQIDIERVSQAHFFIFETQKTHGDELICSAQNYIEDNVRGKISFEELASNLAISRRNFDRRFIKATGNTPVEYMQRVKVEAAKRSLEKGRKNINEVMDEVGYIDDKAFRDVFKKVTGLSPLTYKEKYNRSSATFEA